MRCKTETTERCPGNILLVTDVKFYFHVVESFEAAFDGSFHRSGRRPQRSCTEVYS